MKLPPETRIHPGHREPTTIGEEWERNPFIRVWRGLDEEGDEPVHGRPARRSSARRRRWCSGRPTTTAATRPGCASPDGEDAIVGGSQVKREG